MSNPPIINISPGDLPEQPHPHEPPGAHEEVYYEGSPMLRSHLLRVFFSIVLGLALCAFPIISHTRHWNLPIYADFIAVLLGIFLIILPIFIARSIRYRITNYRIDFERGIFTKKIDTLELWHVEDISFRQNLLDRILGVGSILIDSADRTTPKLHLHGIPKPRPVFESLKQRVIAVKRQRGVLKMDVGDLGVHPG